jgi:hypothetical protein
MHTQALSALCFGRRELSCQSPLYATGLLRRRLSSKSRVRAPIDVKHEAYTWHGGKMFKQASNKEIQRLIGMGKDV